MEELAGVAVRVTPERRRADEWAVVLAAGDIPHRLRPRLDGWALVVAARDADAAREALDAYDRENADVPEPVEARARPVRGAAAVGVAVGLLLLAFFVVTGTRAGGRVWFARGSADAARIVDGEWWRTITALTLHADASHVGGNAVASAVLVGAVCHELGPGVGLGLLLLAGAGGNALTAVVHRAHHDSVGASTALFGAVGLLAAGRLASRARRGAGRKRWLVVGASLALLALLGTSPDADLLAHASGLLVGGVLGLAVPAAPRLRPAVQWGLALTVVAVVVAAWLRAGA